MTEIGGSRYFHNPNLGGAKVSGRFPLRDCWIKGQVKGCKHAEETYFRFSNRPQGDLTLEKEMNFR